MSQPRRSSLLAALALAAVGFALTAVVAPATARGKAGPPPAASWKDVERLIDEQKYEEALEIVGVLGKAAREKRDEDGWTKALVTETRLRTSLHGYETAVRFLKEAPWPPGPRARAILDLYYGSALVTYVRAYSWEIAQREKVDTKGALDLKAWTRDEILTEATRAYAEVWQTRAALGTEPVTALGEYLVPNDYPARIRGTLRDAVSYLFVEMLADTSLWRPDHASEVYRLDLAALLVGAPTAKLDDPLVHPLVRIVCILEDLETWHRAAQQSEAALEARLERVRRLNASFTDAEDRGKLRADLQSRLASLRDVEWWSMGQAELAEMVREQSEPNALADARRLAEAGRQAYPDSIGGQRCLSIVKAIEAPDFSLGAMASDAPRQRSIQLIHRNLPTLYFRAYAADLFKTLEASRDYSLEPGQEEMKRMLRGPQAQQSWSVSLPPTPDFRSHATFVTPPLERPGLYVIAVSAKADFSEASNRVLALTMVVGDLVLVTRPVEGGHEVTCVSGTTGAALPGTEVWLYRYDWQQGHRPALRAVAGADGTAVFPYEAGRERNNFFLVGRKGEDFALDRTNLWFRAQPKPAETAAALVYSDRSVYRPSQTIRFKVVAYRGGGIAPRFQTSPAAALSIDLVDANNQKVETKALTTNGFGSASGEFQIPPGRALGQWWLRTSIGGQAGVRVEEYKRPTFEVKLLDPESALRLNRKAALAGEARYYFGLPVTAGTVRWQLKREPVLPWWWWYRSEGAIDTTSRTVAAGTAALDDSGKFRVEVTPEADEREARLKGVTFRYVLSADVTDEGGETRSATRSFRLGFVSVEATIEAEAAFLREHEPASLTVKRVNLDGVARPGAGAWRIALLRQPEVTPLPADLPAVGEVDAKGYRTPGDSLRPRWEARYTPEAVMASWPDAAEKGKGALKHDDKGEARISLPALPAGAYRIHYDTVDDFGAAYETSKDVVVAGKATPVAVPLLLLAEQSSVGVGKTVRLVVHSGLAGLPMTLDVEKAGRRVSRRTLVAGQADTLVELPVGEADRGGFGVTLTAVRDHQLLCLTAHVLVPWDDRELKLEFQTFRDTLRPGARETWRVTVKTPAGTDAEAGAAELLAYMYDRSLDVYAPHQPPSVLALYPTLWGTSGVRASVGVAPTQWLWDAGFATVPSGPSLTGDRLKDYEDYPIGGPGYRARGGIAGGVVGGMAEEAPATRHAPMPASKAAAPQAMRLDAAGLLSVDTFDSNKKMAPGFQAGAEAAAPEAVPLRSDFSETAFWQPHLLTGSDGSAAIEFTVPDSVTAWNLWVHAITRDLKGASVRKDVRTVKDLMVRPYMPRFLREGDEAELKVVVNNASDKAFSGEVRLEIEDPETGKNRLADFGLSSAARPFTAAAGAGTSVSFPLVTPKGVGSVAVKVVARAGDISDGELRALPLLPGRVHLAQSRFAALKGKDSRSLRFADMERTDDPSRIDERLVVTLDAQLFYGVMQALPYLVSYPYECNEQTLNRFLSTGILSSVFERYPAVARMAKEMAKRETRLETWDATDPNRKMALEETPWLEEAKGGADTQLPLLRVLDPRIAKAERESALARLRKSQTSLGAFPWWPGGPPSPYMTLYIVYGFSRALEFGVDVPKDVTQKAWGYLHRHYLDEIVRDAIGKDCCWELVTFMNFVLSSYPDATWTGGVFTDVERKAMLDFSFRHWKQHSPYTKAYLALTLHRMGRAADARLVFDSVMDSAKSDPDLGTYWAPEDRAWLWYNDTIETHAFALRALMELRPDDPRREGLVQWLFLNKKLNHWKSTRATAEVVYSLVHYLKATGALGVREDARVKVGGKTVDFAFEPDQYTGKANRVVLEGSQIDPKTAATTVVEKQSPGILFASATWHFSTEKMPDEERGDLFSVSRRYFRRENKGGEWTLTPLVENAALAAGDEVEVQLQVRAKHAAEYVHLRDPRAAGLEPGVAVSRYKWDLGLAYYEEIRDSGTNFFFEWLPAGEYTLKYRVRAAMAGRFRVGPATLQSMYAPEFTAYSTGAMLAIR